MNICILNDTDSAINYDSLEKGCGGSETWAIQLGQAFVSRGHFVTICTNTNETFKDVLYADNLNIVPIPKLHNILQQIKFDFVIVSRVITPFIYDALKTYYKSAKYIFYQFHDLYPLEENYKDSLNLVNKIVALTPYHAKYIHVMSDTDYSHFVIIPNGLDFKLFEDIEEPKQRDNRLLWCSNPDRGLYIILKYLYDDIKKEIPDFGIDICYPNYSKFVNTELISGKDVRNIGSLSKKDLYKEMVKHKCWCYPQNFVDTFCISMLEQAMCNVNIVCPWWYAPGDIFGDINKDNNFKKIIKPQDEFSYQFYPEYINSPEFENYIKWLKDNIIDVLKNYDSEKYTIKRYIMRAKTIQNYSWNNIAQLYESLYVNEKIQHNDF